jgi:hypothetical protein
MLRHPSPPGPRRRRQLGEAIDVAWQVGQGDGRQRLADVGAEAGDIGRVGGPDVVGAAVQLEAHQLVAEALKSQPICLDCGTASARRSLLPSNH